MAAALLWHVAAYPLRPRSIRGMKSSLPFYEPPRQKNILSPEL